LGDDNVRDGQSSARLTQHVEHHSITDGISEVAHGLVMGSEKMSQTSAETSNSDPPWHRRHDVAATTRSRTSSSRAIACSLIKLASQVVLTSFIQQANQVITVVTVGHLGDVQFMGGATLGGMVVNVCAFSLMYVVPAGIVCSHGVCTDETNSHHAYAHHQWLASTCLVCSSITCSFAFCRIGFSAAFDTLLAQANGARLYPLQGLIVQRGMVILTLWIVPVSLFLWFFTEPILFYVLEIDAAVSALGKRWARLLLLALWPNLMLNLLTRFMQVRAQQLLHCQRVILAVVFLAGHKMVRDAQVKRVIWPSMIAFGTGASSRSCVSMVVRLLLSALCLFFSLRCCCLQVL